MTWEGLGGCLEVFLPVLRLRVACLHFHQEGAACGSGSDRDMSQVLSYFLGQGILVPPVSDRRVASISNIVRSCAYM